MGIMDARRRGDVLNEQPPMLKVAKQDVLL